jgi:hypothetical protein
MDSGKPDLTRLSSAEIEAMLGRQGTPQAERAELVEELANRLADDVTPTTTGSAGGPPKPPPPSDPTTRPAPRPPPRPSPPPASATTVAPRRKGISGGVAGLLALVLVAAVAGVALAVANGLGDNDPEGSPETTASSFVPSNDSSASATSGETESSGSGGSAGLEGTTSVSWSLGGVTYNATLSIDHGSGVANVSFVDPDLGQAIRVRELLQLDGQAQNYQYSGYRAEDPATGESAASYYSPDTFVFRQRSSGWTVTQVCDVQAQTCAPAG